MGIGAFPENHPLSLGMLGMHGLASANKAVTQSDLIIAAGARFSDRTTGEVSGFAPDAKVIHIDIDPAEIGKNMRTDIPIVGDVKGIIRDIAEKVKHNERTQWIEYISSIKEQINSPIDDSKDLYPQEIIKMLSDKTQRQCYYNYRSWLSSDVDCPIL